jgi:RNase H-fold protein (predicted Holliday junction resolvase)
MPEAAAPHGAPGGAPRVILAFDFGLRRIGAACGDTVSRTASPLRALPASTGAPRWETIDALLREWQPALLVVGLPYNADGSDARIGSAAAARFEIRCRRRGSLCHPGTLVHCKLRRKCVHNKMAPAVCAT